MTKKKTSKKKPGKRAEIVAKKMRPAKAIVAPTSAPPPMGTRADQSTKRPDTAVQAKGVETKGAANKAVPTKAEAGAPNSNSKGSKSVEAARPNTANKNDKRDPRGAKPVSDPSASPAGVSEAAQPLQSFAVEMQRIAKQSIEQTSDVLERLRAAKSVEEVVSLQTAFMQQSFRRYTEFASRISELMTSSQATLFQQSQAAMRSFRSIASGA